ncbi:hypothetical protein [Streptomyces sp. NPDC102409]
MNIEDLDSAGHRCPVKAKGVRLYVFDRCGARANARKIRETERA